MLSSFWQVPNMFQLEKTASILVCPPFWKPSSDEYLNEETLYSKGKTHLLLGDSLVSIVDTKHCSRTASSRSSLRPWADCESRLWADCESRLWADCESRTKDGKLAKLRGWDPRAVNWNWEKNWESVWTPCLFTLLSTFWGWTLRTFGKAETVDRTCGSTLVIDEVE